MRGGVSVSLAQEPDKGAGDGSGLVGLHIRCVQGGVQSAKWFAASWNLLALRGAVRPKSAGPQMSKHQTQKLDNMVHLDLALELVYRFHYILLAKASHKQVMRPD